MARKYTNEKYKKQDELGNALNANGEFQNLLHVLDYEGHLSLATMCRDGNQSFEDFVNAAEQYYSFARVSGLSEDSLRAIWDVA